MSKVFIISGCRTPIGNFQGQFERYSASELGTIVITEALVRANINPDDVDQCIMGQVLTAGQGQNPARQAALNAKIPNTSPAYTINMLCGSGLKYLKESVYVTSVNTLEELKNKITEACRTITPEMIVTACNRGVLSVHNCSWLQI